MFGIAHLVAKKKLQSVSTFTAREPDVDAPAQVGDVQKGIAVSTSDQTSTRGIPPTEVLHEAVSLVVQESSHGIVEERTI